MVLKVIVASLLNLFVITTASAFLIFAVVKKLLYPLKVLWAFWYFFIFALIFLVLYPAFAILLSKEKWFQYANSLRIAWARILFALTGIFYRVQYQEKLNRDRNYV